MASTHLPRQRGSPPKEAMVSSSSPTSCTDCSFDGAMSYGVNASPTSTTSTKKGSIIPSGALRQLLFMACLLPVAIYFSGVRIVVIDHGTATAVETKQEKVSSVHTNKVPTNTHIQPFPTPPPQECCPFAKQLYETRYGGALNYRCCTDRLESLEDLRKDSLTLASFAELQNTTILIQGDSLAEQHFISLLCFAWRYNNKDNGLKTTLKLKSSNPDKLQQSGTIWQAFIQPFNISIQFLRWDRVQVCPTEDYQEDFVILGGWHHDTPNQVHKAMGPFLQKIQAKRPKQKRHATIVSEALPAHFPGGEYLRGKPDGYPKPKVSKNGTKYYPTNPNGNYIDREPVCDSSTDKGTPDVNQPLKSVTKRYNATLLAVFDAYKDRGDAHIGFIPSEGGFVGPKGRDCLHWCVEALDTWALQTWSLLVSLRQ